MNADDMNFRVRDDGCIVCDHPATVRAYVDAHDDIRQALGICVSYVATAAVTSRHASQDLNLCMTALIRSIP